jgi:hypothetical protein
LPESSPLTVNPTTLRCIALTRDTLASATAIAAALVRQPNRDGVRLGESDQLHRGLHAILGQTLGASCALISEPTIGNAQAV